MQKYDKYLNFKNFSGLNLTKVYKDVSYCFSTTNRYHKIKTWSKFRLQGSTLRMFSMKKIAMSVVYAHGYLTEVHDDFYQVYSLVASPGVLCPIILVLTIFFFHHIKIVNKLTIRSMNAGIFQTIGTKFLLDNDGDGWFYVFCFHYCFIFKCYYSILQLSYDHL